jgi:hypothetical protein
VFAREKMKGNFQFHRSHNILLHRITKEHDDCMRCDSSGNHDTCRDVGMYKKKVPGPMSIAKIDDSAIFVPKTKKKIMLIFRTQTKLISWKELRRK